MENKKPGVWKKLHRWPGLIISVVLLYYGITGIFMNHRELFSGLEVSREILPGQYRYQNWNNAAVKGSIVIAPDSVIIFGNIGAWIADSSFSHFKDMNAGFGSGADRRKVADVHRSADGNIYSATLLGAYAWDPDSGNWKQLGEEYSKKRFNSVESKGDTVIFLSRSEVYYGVSEGCKTILHEKELGAPYGYENRVSLFSTVWQIHSGEIFGLPGKIFVDIMGIVTVFLSVTGIIWFFFPGWIKRKVSAGKPAQRLVKIGSWSLKWHNKIGAWTFVILILLYFTGMFLRPPLLLAIANGRVAPLPLSALDQPNPWFDKLRDFRIDSATGKIILSTADGFYELADFNSVPQPYLYQPPVSVMGINVFREEEGGSYTIGSFSGLWSWKPGTSEIYDLISGLSPEEASTGRPMPGQDISGAISLPGNRNYFIRYSDGAFPAGAYPSLPSMPENILNSSGMSLWNLCLEIHTGRIFEGLTGGFYILIVPLAGITGIIVVLSGYLLWRKKYRVKK